MEGDRYGALVEQLDLREAELVLLDGEIRQLREKITEKIARPSGDPFWVKWYARRITRREERRGTVKTEIEALAAKIEELRARDPGLPPIDATHETAQLAMLRERHRITKLTAARLEALHRKSSSLSREMRASRLREVLADVQHLETVIRRVEGRLDG